MDRISLTAKTHKIPLTKPLGQVRFELGAFVRYLLLSYFIFVSAFHGLLDAEANQESINVDKGSIVHELEIQDSTTVNDIRTGDCSHSQQGDCESCHTCHLGHCGLLSEDQTPLFPNQVLERPFSLQAVYLSPNIGGLFRPPMAIL